MKALSGTNASLLSANTGLAADANKLESLKRLASEKSPEATLAVAKQFESLFLNMMLKSMRDAIPKDESGNNEQTQLYTSMLDQQLSQALSAKGGLGLADIIAKQLRQQSNAIKQETSIVDSSNNLGQPPQEIQSKNIKKSDLNSPRANEQAEDTSKAQLESYSQPVQQSIKAIVSQFNNIMGKAAEAASIISGIPSVFILAQAALESGWGKSEIIDRNGNKSHNLFGIKATGNWKGKIAEAMTTEYTDGVPKKSVEAFRAYESYTESFKDFASLMTKSERYQAVTSQIHDPVAYAKAMQDAGYATDPQYAQKLTKTIFLFLNSKD